MYPLWKLKTSSPINGNVMQPVSIPHPLKLVTLTLQEAEGRGGERAGMETGGETAHTGGETQGEGIQEEAKG